MRANVKAWRVFRLLTNGERARLIVVDSPVREKSEGRQGECGGIVVGEGIVLERRKHERFQVEFPLKFKIGRKTLTGSTVNASDEGMLVESSVSSKTALRIFKTLKNKPHYRSEVEFAFGQDVYLRDVEVKHFRLDFSGSEPYRFRVGFWLPKKNKT